jgi:hypothetical protein
MGVSALLDRGHGRPMQRMERIEQEVPPRHTAIRVTFVTPPKRDECYPVPQSAAFIESFNGKCRDECLNEH